MNREQIRYACTRAKEIADAKRKAFITSQPKIADSISDEARYQAIANGTAILRPFNGKSYYINDVYEFPEYIEIQKLKEARNNEIQKYNDTVKKELDKILDKFNLGDSDEAVALLEAFANS